MIERTEFLGYPVDNLTNKDVLYFSEKAIKNNEKHFIAVQNANKMYLSNKIPELKKGLEKASIILPENAINIGKRILGSPLKERNIGGIHIMEKLLEYSNINSWSIYLLGATEKNLEKLVNEIKDKFTNIRLLGYRNGYFSEQEMEEIINSINQVKPNILFVGLGSPKQELFIIRNMRQLIFNIAIGVGGSFNVIAGIEKPAPKWTKHGLEWLYRSFQDPKKFKRYIIINSFFIKELVKYKCSGR